MLFYLPAGDVPVGEMEELAFAFDEEVEGYVGAQFMHEI